MAKTKIEWCEETWNPVTGCTKISEGCRNCYAETMHKRLKAMGSRKYQHDFNSNVCLHPEEIDRDFGNKSKLIFVNSMSDIFHDDVPDDFISEIFHSRARHPQQNFLFLTKRPFKNKPFNFSHLPHFLPNVWFGVTVENEEAKKRIEILNEYNKHYSKFAVQFLSCEPLLEDLGKLDLSNIDWVIAGGESGPNARPLHPDWVRNIQKQCQEQNVPFFFKQWGEWSPHCPQGKKAKIVVFKTENLGKTTFDGPNIMYKVGKSKAGSLLDGKEYKEFPAILGEVHGR